MKFGKWLGGGFGWILGGGPLGGILGFILGSVIDEMSGIEEKTKTMNDYSGATTAGDFGLSLLVLSAAVMKADGRVTRMELKFVQNFFIQNFGREATADYMQAFKEIIKRDIPVDDVCNQIMRNMDYESRLLLLQYLFGLSHVDESLLDAEIRLLMGLSQKLGISTADFRSIQSMYVVQTYSPYSILEIKESATDEEVKSAFRQMAMRFHPDKVAHLGEEHQKKAQEKFVKVQEAYEKIKLARGLA